MIAAALLPALLVPVLAAPPVELMGKPDENATVLPLWEAVEVPAGGIPGGLAGGDAPTLSIHKPENPNGTAIVVCPGGGYGTLATGHEGKDVAAWLNSKGITAGVLRYRVSPNRHPAPLLDVQRGIRLMRKHAKEYGVDPAKVGVLGFSAGGHLAASAATLHTDEARELNPLADADPLAGAVSARPDFAVMIYPVITFTGDVAHRGSARNLLGADATDAQYETFSLQNRVTAETSPSFLVATNEDAGVPPENSVLFWQACRAHKVPAELHVYQHGPHGFGLGDAKGRKGPDWTGACEKWLAGRGLLGE
ncbi:alpha/beta hydrolase [Alienimonas californiensis]|uniref:Acetylxylan esterase n=1 Tax=Alienimonas californiensis TaxID=2527989 RepID=A0A517P7N9_9PLAN|nr:alpha/beta hydrolase [Alienimonas californiensis]QDT15375.1 Acetylxylan esterase precursor [Alienimonas californiensis]